METRTVKCPYDGVPYNKVPGYVDGYGCPYCIAIWQDHNEVERTFLTNEEAEEILKKYVKRHWVNGKEGYVFNAGKDILGYAWYSQHWPDYAVQGDGYSKLYNKRDWMVDDIILAFDWYLDGVGRDLGYGYGRGERTFEKGYEEELKKELTEFARNLENEKYKKQREAIDRRNKKMEEKGDELVSKLNIGDVVLVKFDRGGYGYRPLQVLEIEGGFVAGFYLDREDQIVIADAPEKEGYVYTKPSKYTWVKVDGEYLDGKFEWDGKTMKKTRTYVSKDTKFVKEIIKNPVILK